jgi:hypothetical protein
MLKLVLKLYFRREKLKTASHFVILQIYQCHNICRVFAVYSVMASAPPTDILQYRLRFWVLSAI